ncbi:MAG TPA: relaxase/mobilization nuclease domain-containing protein [Puia sp.]|uniref:relaxase/mobilization nuclease domain-containing protein n=1 Tax=Puia sp. TaxID=2045100 RepID=UPI002BFC32A6|nr:relaxase/mobilization nuclease domain-containing protein [Puia sp.]HVU96897.1 relaxase/mobilization nuclease domain-containing protein [Puia sp.]
MISKVLPAARSFRSCCQYVCQDRNRAKVLKAEGVRGHDHKKMADDFENQRSLRPGKRQAVFHSVLSSYPGERVSDKKMVGIAEQYLTRIGMVNTQYVIAKHTDKEHLHMHVIANRVDNEGRSIAEGWLGLRAKKVAQELTREHNLKAVRTKDLALTHKEFLQPAEAKRYQIYDAIVENLPKSKDLTDLEVRLLKRGIDILYKLNQQTQEPEGISFRLEKQCYKGSQIDREFSLFGLERHFETKRLALEQEQQYGLGYSQSHGKSR